jgi:hypothetical protein
MAIDPAQTLKSQIGELVWANAALMGQVQTLTEELEALKKEKTDGPSAS